MARLSQERIIEIQDAYREIGIYSQVAKRLGCSAATVKKYCSSEYMIVEKTDVVRFSSEIPSVEELDKNKLINYDLTEDELKELERLWKDI